MSKKLGALAGPQIQRATAYITGRGTTVRLKMPDGSDEPLCTCTYNRNMSLQLRQDIAKRIVAMWNANR